MAEKKDDESGPSTIPMRKFKLFLKEINTISKQREATDVAVTVITQTCDVLECDRTSFFFVDGDFLDLVIAKGAKNIRMPKASGFAGDCAMTASTVNIPDAYQDSRFNPSFDKKSGYKTKQILCVPVTDEKKNVMGVLQAINTKSGNPFDTTDESLLSSIAEQVAVSLQNAQQIEEAEKARDQLNALITYIKNINISATANSILFTLNKAASELLEADRCTVYIVDLKTDTMHIASADASVDITLPVGVGIAGSVAKTGELIRLDDCYADERFDQSWDKKTGYTTKSMLVMPVWPERAPVKRNVHLPSHQISSPLATVHDGSVSKTSSTKPGTPGNSFGFGSAPQTPTGQPLKDDEKSYERRPIAVVQLINKRNEKGSFDKDDEELLEVLLRFISPTVSHSSLFQRKRKRKEFELTSDLTNRDRMLYRQPSRELRSTLPLKDVDEAGEGEEEDELL